MLISIFDNQKKIGICDNCGASIRYEYVTDTGIFGSECVKQHLSLPEWVTLNGKKDVEYFNLRVQTIDRLYNNLSKPQLCYPYIPVYHEAKDGSGKFMGYTYQNEIAIAPIVLAKLLENGYRKTLHKDNGHIKTYFIEKV